MVISKKISSLAGSLKKKKGLQQVSLMMVITLLTQAISMYKSSITASNFGACVELDAYNFANNLATFFLTFVSTGITTVIIPSYIKKIDRKAIDTFLSVVFCVIGILLITIYAFRVELVDLLTNREEQFGFYVNKLLLLTILIQLFPAMLGVTTAYYQCIDKFNFPKIVLLISNAATMLVYLNWDKFTIYQYLYVMLAGVVFQFTVDLVYAVKCGFRFRITFDLKNVEFKKLGYVFLPTLLSTGIYKVNTMVDSLLSSNLGTGQLTILTYSQMIVGLVNSLIISNLTAFVYPKIVAKLTKSLEEGQKAVFSYINGLHSVIVLLIIGFFAVGREFIGILYERGEFTAQAADAVYICMCIYIFGQQNNIVRDILYRFFMAQGDTKTTTKNGLMTSCCNIVLSCALVRPFGIYGIAIGTILAGIVSLCGITIRMKRKYGFTVNVKPYLVELGKTEVLMIVATVGIFVLKLILPVMNDIIAFFFYGMISVLLYAVLFLVVKSKAFNNFI